MNIYLAWWHFHDSYEGDSGLLGIFSSFELAEKACIEYTLTNDDPDQGASVTVVQLDKHDFEALSGRGGAYYSYGERIYEEEDYGEPLTEEQLTAIRNASPASHIPEERFTNSLFDQEVKL